ncbi:MAG: sulfotransferase [Micromonosporaceae bacterium]|nr:sulfotransferase [Micromonosporaceae bacterium]
MFLGGLGRSGTTLLERILGQLPDACPLGEVVHLWQRDLKDCERCACGAAFSDCDFWRRVGEVAYGGWDAVDVDRVLWLKATVERTRHILRLAGSRLAPGHYDLVREYASHYGRVYAAAAEVSGARVVIDSSKHPSLAYCLRWAPDIDLHVAHMVRDSRGVAYSWTKTVRRPEAAGDTMTRYHPARSALLWSAHNVALDRLGRCGVPVRRIRYEDLAKDPVAATKELAEFAGIDAGPLDFLSADAGAVHAELTAQHSAAGNPMRFHTGRIPLLADEAWRTGLPVSHQRLVGALTSPLLRAYGYLK